MEQNHQSLKAFTILFQASQTIQDVVRKDLLRYDLNPSEFSVLEFLYHHGEQPVQTICKKVLLASSSITYVIDKLEQKRFVYRHACPNDRRVTYIVLTVEGRQLMDAIFPEHVQIIDRIFEVLEKKELNTMMLALKKVSFHTEEI
ncbi:MarR family winged helix-turn-helix transcriptional regulator [Lysinibacillus piscis]|uniref:MarR family transcriptional regulator n=1 Tax=Lysinibacillus piscis TaxID=2518931 RepID=A0ABQ5NPS1_9BACI|nr:MarR family transcriptional regulator [Lysinibacillus sp. KH24]GLC90230.1 MarR family transcriptional regulator [Lysinibacillus sp. KH24]